MFGMEREPRLPLAGLWGERASTGILELAQIRAGKQSCRPPPWACLVPMAVFASVRPRPSPPVPESFTVLSSLPWSLINLLHLPDDLLFEDGQDGVILPHLLEDHTTVELVAHFLKVIPEKNRNVEGGEGKKSR